MQGSSFTQKQVADFQAGFIALKCRQVIIGSIKFLLYRMFLKWFKITGSRLGIKTEQRSYGKSRIDFYMRLQIECMGYNLPVVVVKTIVRFQYIPAAQKRIKLNAQGNFKP